VPSEGPRAPPTAGPGAVNNAIIDKAALVSSRELKSSGLRGRGPGRLSDRVEMVVSMPKVSNETGRPSYPSSVQCRWGERVRARNLQGQPIQAGTEKNPPISWWMAACSASPAMGAQMPANNLRYRPLANSFRERRASAPACCRSDLSGLRAKLSRQDNIQRLFRSTFNRNPTGAGRLYLRRRDSALPWRGLRRQRRAARRLKPAHFFPGPMCGL